jgi:uncharacterized delta-60 repeat protein
MAFPLVLLCIGLTDCGEKAGTTTVFAPPTAIAVKRYTAGGQLDAGFSGGAVFTKIDPSEFEYALAVALQPTGNKIIVAGHSVLAGQGAIALVRYNADGSLDTTFGSGGTGTVRTAVGSDGAEAVAVAVQADGKIVVAGTILAPNFSGKGIVLLRYLPDGALDPAFGAAGIVTKTIGTGSDTAAAALALQPAALPADERIVVAGHAFTGTKTDIVLLKYNANGTPDLTFGSVTPGLVTTPLASDAAALAIQLQPPGNKIVAAGSVGNFSNSSMDSVLLRYNTDGALDPTFGDATTPGRVITDIGSGNNFANAIALQPADGKIVVAGHANVNFSLDTSDIALLRYDTNGLLETTFGAPGQGGKVVTTLGGFDNAFSVALQPTAIDPNIVNIVVSGNTGSAGSVTRVAVLRFDASGSLDPTFGTDGLVTTPATGPSTFASGNAVLIHPDGIVVAGYD